MDPSFHDPNNHVPEVAPADTWDDAEQVTADSGDSVTILPRIRAVIVKPVVIREVEERPALVLGNRKAEPVSSDPVERLEMLKSFPKVTVTEGSSLPNEVSDTGLEGVVVIPEMELQEPVPGADDFDKWGNQKRVSMRWIVISVAALAVVFFAGALLLPKLGWKGEKSQISYYSRIDVDRNQNAPEVQDDSGLGLGFEEEADRVARAYAAAKTLDEVLQLVRDRERVEPGMRSRWKSLGLTTDWKIPEGSQWDLRQAQKRDFGVMTGFFPDVTSFRFIVVREGDRIVLDWEATTGYSETTFEDLGRGSGSGGMTRGTISSGDLYTVSLPEGHFQCYRIISPDGQVSIWGYVRRDHPAAVALASLFREGAIPKEMLAEHLITVRLVNPPHDSLPNQWLIAEMLHIDWITP